MTDKTRQTAKILPFTPRPKPAPKEETPLDMLERQLFNDADP